MGGGHVCHLLGALIFGLRILRGAGDSLGGDPENLTCFCSKGQGMLRWSEARGFCDDGSPPFSTMNTVYAVGTSGKPCPYPYSVLTKIFNLHRWLVADTSGRTALGKGTLDSVGPGVCGDLHTGIN